MKNNSKFIIGIFIGLLISSVVSVTAYTLLSSDVQYTPENNNWEVTNVKDALDNLYINANGINVDNLEKLTDGVSFDGDYFMVATPDKIVWNSADSNNINFEKIIFCHKTANHNANFTATLPFNLDGKTFEVKLIKKNGNYGWNPSIRSASGNSLNIDVNYGLPELAEYFFTISVK